MVSLISTLSSAVLLAKVSLLPEEGQEAFMGLTIREVSCFSIIVGFYPNSGLMVSFSRTFAVFFLQINQRLGRRLSLSLENLDTI